MGDKQQGQMEKEGEEECLAVKKEFEIFPQSKQKPTQRAQRKKKIGRRRRKKRGVDMGWTDGRLVGQRSACVEITTGQRVAMLSLEEYTEIAGGKHCLTLRKEGELLLVLLLHPSILWRCLSLLLITRPPYKVLASPCLLCVCLFRGGATLENVYSSSMLSAAIT